MEASAVRGTFAWSPILRTGPARELIAVDLMGDPGGDAAGDIPGVDHLRRLSGPFRVGPSEPEVVRSRRKASLGHLFFGFLRSLLLLAWDTGNGTRDTSEANFLS